MQCIILNQSNFECSTLCSLSPLWGSVTVGRINGQALYVAGRYTLVHWGIYPESERRLLRKSAIGFVTNVVSS